MVYNKLLSLFNCLHFNFEGWNIMEEKTNDKWISIEEAAEYLGIKPVTLRCWIRNGKDVPAQKIGKKWKFKRSELDAWVKSGKSAIEN